jgi:ABC-2 type transport system permease protein
LQPSEAARGNIYDLGYRRYEGARLGRLYAAWSLYAYSLKACFGLGRGTKSKILPVGLGLVVFIPAAIQLGIASLTSGEIELREAQGYYGYIEIVLVLFTAAVAPELVARDQRNRTLALYFSRPIMRSDYALAKLAALASALLLLTVGPQALMFAGNALSSPDAADYIRDNLDDVPPIAGAALLIAFFMGSVGLAIASQTSRRAYGAGAILIVFILGAALGAILVNGFEGEARRYGIFISGIHLMRGATDWFFGVTPHFLDGGREGDLAEAGFSTWVYVVASLAVTAGAIAALIRRYERISA